MLIEFEPDDIQDIVDGEIPSTIVNNNNEILRVLLPTAEEKTALMAITGDQSTITHVGTAPPVLTFHGLLWIDTTNPDDPTLRYFYEPDEEVEGEFKVLIQPNLIVSDVVPPAPFEGLIWLDTSGLADAEPTQPVFAVYVDDAWQPVAGSDSGGAVDATSIGGIPVDFVTDPPTEGQLLAVVAGEIVTVDAPEGGGDATAIGGIPVDFVTAPPEEGQILAVVGGEVVAIDAPEGGGSGGSGGSDPVDNPPAVANPMDDEFSVDAAGPVIAGWTWRNRRVNVAPLDIYNTFARVEFGRLILTQLSGGSDGNNNNHLRSLVKSIAAEPWKVQAKITLASRFVNFVGCGLVIRNSATNNCVCNLSWSHGGYDDRRLMATRVGAAGDIVNAEGGGNFGKCDQTMYFQMERTVGNSVIFSMSHDGINWIPYHTEVIASYIGAVDEFGIAFFPQKSGDQEMIAMTCHWFRRIF